MNDMCVILRRFIRYHYITMCMGETCHANNLPCRWLQRHRQKHTTMEFGLSGRVAKRAEVLTFSGFCFVRLMTLTRWMIN